jgi:D-alanyl-D-alanine carboxypeptidase
LQIGRGKVGIRDHAAAPKLIRISTTLDWDMGHPPKDLPIWRRLIVRFAGLVVGVAGLLQAAAARADPALVMDVSSGEVLYEEQAADPWYPASLTKLMTLYVALNAVREHRIALDTPIVVSPRAASQLPSKMGFTPGTQVTLDNALKMLMVKSANDMAVTIAEGVSGSVEAFAEDMNNAAASLGMRQSHFVNPNGLHDPAHVSSARDLALLARALYASFPESTAVFGIGTLQLGEEMILTHNMLLGRYAGADGMKTGFTCSAGFNLVASAQRNGRRFIAVVLGAPSVSQRSVKAAILLDRAFAGVDHPRGVMNFLPGHAMQASATAPDMRNEVCRRRSVAMARYETELEALQAPLAHQSSSFVADNGLFVEAPNAALKANLMSRKFMSTVTSFNAVPVFVGAPSGYSGLIAQARPPHSPIGTEPPPELAAAYAAKTETVETPLKPDTSAVSLKARGRHQMAHAKGSDEDEGSSKPTAKAHVKAAPTHGHEAKKPVPKAVKAKAAKTKVAHVVKPKQPKHAQ